jgi:hypothetical protein
MPKYGMKGSSLPSTRGSRMEVGIDAAPTVLKQNVTLFSRFVPMVKLLYQDHMVLVVLVKMGRKLKLYQLNPMIAPSKCTNG